MKAEIISIGSEILIGETTDTNAAYLAGQLPQFGIELCWVTQVGDIQGRIVEVLKRAWGRSELILVTGGLGPTSDDITRESIAELLGEIPEVNPQLETTLRQRFYRLSSSMPLSNLKQATLIPSARAIPNDQGSAPGWWVEKEGRILIAMPGPPREMHDMWQKGVMPGLLKRASSIIIYKTFKTIGLSESVVGEMIFPLFTGDNPVPGVYAKNDGVQVRLTASATNRQKAEEIISEGEVKVREVLGKHIWGTDNDTMEKAVAKLLTERGKTLAVMEDYTGGFLASSLNDITGSKTFFRGGLIVCSEEARRAFGLDGGIISRHGAVSPEAAQMMAEAARTYLKADIGMAITGITGNENDMDSVIYTGITDGRSGRAIIRPRGKQRATATALSELRKSLLSPERLD